MRVVKLSGISDLYLHAVVDSSVCLEASCSHDCIVNPTAPNRFWCLCPKGMIFPLNTTCIPNPRTCDSWGVCGQRCSTLSRDGSLKCYCDVDYNLDPDMYTCNHIGKRLIPHQPIALLHHCQLHC